MRKLLPSLLLLLLPLLATPVHAATAAAQADNAFLTTLAAPPAACATELPADATAPAKDWKVTCRAAFCLSDDQCPCNGGFGSCINESCHYSGTGGGGGTTGPNCKKAFCSSSVPCPSCIGASGSTCSANVCSYF